MANHSSDVRQMAARICGSKNVSFEPQHISQFTRDGSLFDGHEPIVVAWPENAECVRRIVSMARDHGVPLLPVSSSPGARVHGDSIARSSNHVIIDMSRMKTIEKVDRSHRVVAIQPGVTFDSLLPVLRKNGLRLNMPVGPRVGKSVLASALDREPVAMPRYQWDSSDPLLCTELVFGTGDAFRTGSAAGPGSIKEQRKAGQAQVNPMGPTQFNPVQFIQGAQGTLGIVTWATIKCEVLPTIQHVHHISSKSMEELLALQHELVKFRLCDETFIMNELGLASLLGEKRDRIESIARDLGPWNLTFVTSGSGVSPDERVSYLDADVNDLLGSFEGKIRIDTGITDQQTMLDAITEPTRGQWRSRSTGAHEAIYFITGANQIPGFIALWEKISAAREAIVYVQPGNLGTSCHCEFDITYDPGSSQDMAKVKARLPGWHTAFIEAGAFFSRPHGTLAKLAFQHYSQANVTALKKVKAIFDPANILNPGALCFDDARGGVA
jgi:FAD/FMN-containing dehydrogenase